MRAYDLAIQNFSVAEHLLQLYELFRDLREEVAAEPLRLAVCKALSLPDHTTLRQARNDQVVMVAKAAAPIPQSLLVPDGIDFLLRQAVVVACTALESFISDALRENVLTIVRARKRRADDSLKKLTLSLDDYLSLESYADPEIRLKQIILKNFQRKTLYDASSIEEVAAILTVREYWKYVSKKCGQSEGELKRQIGELIARRNQIAHRADRPDEEATPPEEADGHGLRVISFAWVHTRVATARTVVSASSDVFRVALDQLESQIRQDEEQKLAQQTLTTPGIVQAETPNS